MPNQHHESGSNSGYCFTDFSMLWISKIEILSSDPLVVYFHDLLSKHTIRQIVEDANPHLEVPRTVSSKDRTIKSTSSKRSGKVAFISHQGHLKVSVLLYVYMMNTTSIFELRNSVCLLYHIAEIEKSYV